MIGKTYQLRVLAPPHNHFSHYLEVEECIAFVTRTNTCQCRPVHSIIGAMVKTLSRTTGGGVLSFIHHT